MILRESIPREVDKKSRVPEEEKGVQSLQEGERGLGALKKKRTHVFFFPHYFVLVYITIYLAQGHVCP